MSKRRSARSRRRRKIEKASTELDPDCSHAWSKWSEPDHDGHRWRFCRSCKGLYTEGRGVGK